MKNLLADRLSAIPETGVIIEPSLRTPKRILKPNHVVINEGRIDVADIIVRVEDRNNLKRASYAKIAKYRYLVGILAKEWYVAPGRVVPITIGAREVLPRRIVDGVQMLYYV